MHRFFVSPEILKQQPVMLADAEAHQIRHVLRLQPGDRVTLLDNTGLVYEAEIAAFRGAAVLLTLLSSRSGSREPSIHVTLCQAVLKGDHFNWVLQKGTEVGISRFVPIVCERSVVADRAAIDHKRARWGRIIQEAAEQSGRARLPELAGCRSLSEMLRATPAAPSGPCRVIAWEGERATGLRAALAACNLGRGSRIEVFVGPEGGFTEEEVQLAKTNGICPISLGPRILRSETAGLVAASVILYTAGDLEVTTCLKD